jgi:RNA polymerase sigma-70 factor, ECF subfamily
VRFEESFQEIYPSLFRYLHRLTGDPDSADDIAQEAFLKLLAHGGEPDDARVWLFTVATNLVRDDARKSKRRERLLSAVPPEVQRRPLPDEDVERSEQVAQVRQVLEQLPPRDRQLLLMREEGFKYDEIAQAVGVAPGSVGTLVSRALKRFAEIYRPEEEHHEPRR